ncbi:uncharacterized protein LOC132717634 isoform X2 [Ruditapes philippinarum]|nr:uncharacterized protein LOC132717634 isoform X2 [Ruditapes philippinarum]
MFTLWYASPVLTLPFISASGVWTGILTFVIYELGMKIVKDHNNDNQSRPTRKVKAIFTCIIADVIFGILHVSFSAVGLSYCSKELRTGGFTCNERERPRLLLMESFNIAFGVFITLLSVATTIYFSLKKRISILAGKWTEAEAEVT